MPPKNKHTLLSSRYANVRFVRHGMSTWGYELYSLLRSSRFRLISQPLVCTKCCKRFRFEKRGVGVICCYCLDIHCIYLKSLDHELANHLEFQH